MNESELKTKVIYDVYSRKVFLTQYSEAEQQAIYELITSGYLKMNLDNINLTEQTNVMVRFNKTYEAFLAENLPIRTPATQEKYTKTSVIQRGIGSKRKWVNDLIKYFAYPLLVAIVAAIVLKLLGVL